MCHVLLGGAIGDALGMPFESKLSNYQPLIDWDGKTFLSSELHQLKAGQWTDDSQMQQMIAESLIENHGFNPDDLSKRYVDWIVSKRARGFGKSTMMAVSNLINGKHWSESGVPGSYGNGTAMRSAPFGVYFRNDLQSLVSSCKVDSAITHLSEEAEAGSLAIALATAFILNNDTENLLHRICDYLPDSKVKWAILSLDSLIETSMIPSQVLQLIGTKADVRQTVPASLFCFMKFDNYTDAVITAIRGGNDSDTTASIVGALFGAKMSVPEDLAKQVEDYDRLLVLDSQLYNRSNDNFLMMK